MKSKPCEAIILKYRADVERLKEWNKQLQKDVIFQKGLVHFYTGLCGGLAALALILIFYIWLILHTSNPS